jgi:hypothetical protein
MYNPLHSIQAMAFATRGLDCWYSQHTGSGCYLGWWHAGPQTAASDPNLLQTQTTAGRGTLNCSMGCCSVLAYTTESRVWLAACQQHRLPQSTHQATPHCTAAPTAALSLLSVHNGVMFLAGGTPSHIHPLPKGSAQNPAVRTNHDRPRCPGTAPAATEQRRLLLHGVVRWSRIPG